MLKRFFLNLNFVTISIFSRIFSARLGRCSFETSFPSFLLFFLPPFFFFLLCSVIFCFLFLYNDLLVTWMAGWNHISDIDQYPNISEP